MKTGRTSMPLLACLAMQGRSALTLVEVAVAMVVFLAGILGAFTYFSYSQISLNMDSRYRIAAEIAQSRVEELRTTSFDLLPSSAEEGYAVDMSPIAGSRDTVVEDIDEDGDALVDYRKVTVTVVWVEHGRNQEVELITYRSPYR